MKKGLCRKERNLARFGDKASWIQPMTGKTQLIISLIMPVECFGLAREMSRKGLFEIRAFCPWFHELLHQVIIVIFFCG